MSEFQIIHAAHLHPPYGMWIVRHRGIEIGRQISRPNEADCTSMLRKFREAHKAEEAADLKPVSYHLGGAAATRESQRRGGYHKHGKRQARRV